LEGEGRERKKEWQPTILKYLISVQVKNIMICTESYWIIKRWEGRGKGE
jgi:hypothetical protein